MIENIRHNAELVRSVAREQLEVEVNFDREGVVWLNGFITRQYYGGESLNIEGLTDTLGSFLGECIAHTYRCQWAEDEYGWHLQFDANNVVYPFSKTGKHLRNGPEDSVLSFFDSIAVLFDQFRRE